MGYWRMTTLKMLREMARDIGSYSRFDNIKYRKDYYDATKNHPITKKLTPDITEHKKCSDNKVVLSTNDHKTGECLYNSSISTRDKDHSPKRIEQDSVQRAKDSRLPKGYATDKIYEHFKSQELPLKSSDEQMKSGNKMWHRLVHRALEDGHHVYHYDGSNLHKTNKANVNAHLANYYGSDEKRTRFNPTPKDNNYENKHMIISKKELDV